MAELQEVRQKGQGPRLEEKHAWTDAVEADKLAGATPSDRAQGSDAGIEPVDKP